MVKKLNDIIALIEEHFFNCVWNSRPPLKEFDYQLIVLVQKIIDLRNTLDELKCIDTSISEIMTYMEQTFHIPLLDTKEYLKDKPIRYQLVLDIYTRLSNLRSI